MTRDQNSRPPTAKAERLSKALRENLKRRKAQLRGRGAAEKAPEDEPSAENSIRHPEVRAKRASKDDGRDK